MKKQMFKRVSAAILAMVMMIVMMPAVALPIAAETLSGECGASGSSVTWEFDPDTGTLTISGTGNMADYSSATSAPWYSIRASILRIVFEEGVTKIGKSSFSGFPNVMTVTLPSTLTGGYSSIGASAFRGCNKLVEVINFSNLPLLSGNQNYGYVSYYAKAIHTGDSKVVSENGFTFYPSEAGNYLLSYSGSETELILPESYNGENYMIHNYAFNEFKTLKRVTLPETVTAIGNYAFSGCTSLESINLPSKLTGIGTYAFYNCSSLKSISLPAGLTSMGDYAFSGCSALESKITVPGGVPSVGLEAFRGCVNLTEVSLSEGVTSIGKYAFKGCEALESINIPDSVISVGQDAFEGCDGVIEKENKVWYVDKWIVDSDEDVTGEGLRSDTVGIAYSAMSYKNNIRIVVLPDSVKYIGYSAFSYCKYMRSITISKGVIEIEDHAFDNCGILEVVNNSSLTVEVGSISHGHLAYGAMDVHSGTSKIEESGDYWYYNFEGVNYMIEYLGSDTEIILPANYKGEAYEMYGVFNGKTNITSITLPEGMTSVGDGAFLGCSGLTNVYIPSSVTSIGESAFAKCTSLTSITILSGVESIGDGAFSNCTALESVTINDNSKLKSIGYQTFNECSKLTSITFGNNSCLESIGQRAFYNCKLLADIDLPDSLISVGENAFSFCNSLIEAENGVKYVDTWAIMVDKTHYSGSTSWDIVLRDGTEGIADSTFGYSYYVKSVQFPSTLRSIGSSAFASCDLIEQVIIPDNVVYIGDFAFRDCRGATSITISDNSKLQSIGNQAFYGCRKLGEINLPDSLTNISDYAFADCESLTSIVIPDGITRIGDYMFADCIKLESIYIPDSVTSIGDYAFRSCESLVNISIPQNVTSIGAYAFHNCSSLKKINIPGSLESLEGYMFSGCSAIESYIYCGTESEWEAMEKDAYWGGSYYPPEVVFHNYADGICTECGAECAHETVVDDTCSLCGKKVVDAILGDVDGNGTVTNSDVLMIFRYIYNADLYPLDVTVGDVDKNGTVTNSDVLMIFRYIYNPTLYPLG